MAGQMPQSNIWGNFIHPPYRTIYVLHSSPCLSFLPFLCVFFEPAQFQPAGRQDWHAAFSFKGGSIFYPQTGSTCVNLTMRLLTGFAQVTCTTRLCKKKGKLYYKTKHITNTMCSYSEKIRSENRKKSNVKQTHSSAPILRCTQRQMIEAESRLSST